MGKSKLSQPRKDISDLLIKLGFTRSDRAIDAYHAKSTGSQKVKIKIDIKGRNAKIFLRMAEVANWIKTDSRPLTSWRLEALEDYLKARLAR